MMHVAYSFPHCMHACAYSCRLYEHPDQELIREYTQTLMHAIDRSLSKGSDGDNTIRIAFRHDVYRRLFRNKLELYLDDFDKTYFTPGWDQCCRQYKGVSRTIYAGCKVRFPLTITLYLDWTKPSRFYIDNTDKIIVRKKQIYIEMIRVQIVKDDF